MELHKFLSAETPFYIVGLLGVVYWLQRQVWKLEKKVEILQAQVTSLHAIHVAVKSCAVQVCPLKHLVPEPVFRPTLAAE